MRRALLLFATVAALSAAPVGAETWGNAQSRMSFTTPDDWSVTQLPAEGMTYMLATAHGHECHLMAVPRPETAGVGPERIHAGSGARFERQQWRSVAGSLSSVFAPDATLTNLGVDRRGPWPIQTADFRSDGKPVHAAIQFRPGVEFWGFCLNRTGDDDPSTYSTILRSIAATNDAQLAEDMVIAERARTVRDAQMRGDGLYRSQAAEIMRGRMESGAKGGPMQ